MLTQRAALEHRAQHTTEMIRAIDAALAVIDGANDAAIVEEVCDAPRSGESFSEQEGTTVDMKKIFNGFDPDKYADEVKQRWGDADPRGTKSYTEADWKRCMDEQGAVYADAVAAMKSGKAPSDPAAMDIAERHRQSIDRWFYPCSTGGIAGSRTCTKPISASRRTSTSMARRVSRRSCRPRSARTRSAPETDRRPRPRALTRLSTGA